jgi:hypothetical protein
MSPKTYAAAVTVQPSLAMLRETWARDKSDLILAENWQ